MSKRKSKQEYFSCPHCGADVPVGAAACRECGSDEETGWSEDAYGESLSTSEGYADEDDFDYDEFVHREFPEDATPRSLSARQLAVIVLVVILCLGMLVYSLGF